MSGSYIQLAPYLLLEYIYGDESSKHLATQYKLARLSNAYTSEITFLNTNTSKNVTQNVLDYTATNIGGADWVILDKDVPVPYISQDSNIKYEDMSSILGSLDITYDTVKLHIQSGYNFDNIEGLLFQLYVREAQSTKMSYLTSNAFLKDTNRVNFNPNPIFITDKIYDRYIQIMVPSVKEANNKYYLNPGNIYSLGYQYSSVNKGYQFDTQIYVKMAEISTVTKKNSITFFKTQHDYEVNIKQEDVYTNVNAVVREAVDGDYFEYFASYNGNFPADLIEELNSMGGHHVIIHQLDVIEQVDTRFVTTNTFTQVQSGNFEEPLLYRPILKYAGISPAFSIDYTCRIYNTENSYQIIKTSSVTSFNPTKYGKNTDKISLSNVVSPLKVYNKIFNNTSIAYNNVLPTNSFNTVYVPVFYDSKNLYMGTTSVLAAGQNPGDPNFNADSVYFGQGASRIYLGDFEQYVKFSIKQFVTKTNTLNSLDLSNMSVSIGFEDTTGKMFSYPALQSTIEHPLSSGEIVFKIAADVRKRIGLDGSSIKNFYILNSNPGSNDVKMYIGSVDYDINLSNESDRIKILGSQAITLSSLLAKNNIEDTISATIDINASSQEPSILNQLTKMTNRSIGKNESKNQVLNTVIPGFTTDTNASNFAAIVPSGK